MADNNAIVATDGDSSLLANDSGDDHAMEEKKSGFSAALGNADMLRQITLVVALSICLAIAVFVIILANEAEYRMLSKLPTEQLIKTMDFLDANKVDYRHENNTLLVPTDEYQNVKLLLAREGLTNEPSEGEDMLMKDMGFGVSQRLERERVKYGREQRLAKTIEQLQSISQAKVLLAIPRENIFARREKNPSATVVVTMQRGRILSAEEVDAVVDIVASSVQGLSPNRVTVTDQNGRLLNSGSQNSISARSRNELDIEQKREQEYMDKIDCPECEGSRLRKESLYFKVNGKNTYKEQIKLSQNNSSKTKKAPFTVKDALYIFYK